MRKWVEWIGRTCAVIVVLGWSAHTFAAEACPENTACASWTYQGPSDVTGFRLLWGEASRTYDSMQEIDDPTARDTTLTFQFVPEDLPKTLFFAMVAVDTSGNLSDFSNEVTKTFTFTDENPPAPTQFQMEFNIRIETGGGVIE